MAFSWLINGGDPNVGLASNQQTTVKPSTATSKHPKHLISSLTVNILLLGLFHQNEIGARNNKKKCFQSKFPYLKIKRKKCSRPKTHQNSTANCFRWGWNFSKGSRFEFRHVIPSWRVRVCLWSTSFLFHLATKTSGPGVGQEAPKKHPNWQYIPSRELTYPTLGSSENHRLKMPFWGDMLVPWRVSGI